MTESTPISAPVVSADNYITLGVTSLRVSPLGFGTWQYGDRLMWDYGKGGYGDEDLRASFQIAVQAGINFFDTAETYGDGRSETLLGRFIHEPLPETPGRQPVVVATKFMPYPWRWTKKNLLDSLRNSLKRLGLEKVDLYQMHWPTPPVPVETWAGVLADAVQMGLARAVGVSNYSTSQMRRAYDVLAKRGVPLASNQVLYNLLHRDPDTLASTGRDSLMKACRELNVTLIAYSPISQGLLSGKYSVQNPPTGLRRMRYLPMMSRLQPLLIQLRFIGDAHNGKTPAQVALNWVMCKGALPIPGPKNADQAREIIGALGWRLTEEEIAALDKASS
jgi:aryl-alcohol dehydrogenase-like predicted oxidoreductase